MSFYVYRAYDEAGTLLYVGSTRHVDIRMGHGHVGKGWRRHVARVVSSEPYATRVEADAAEREAIATEHPTHNRLRYSPVDRSATDLVTKWIRPDKPPAPTVPAETAEARRVAAARLAHVAEEWRDLQARADDARESVAAAARECHANGMSAYRIAKVTGAAPDTIRKWLQS